MAMQNLELSRDLRELLECFLTHEVRFLVIGGHAVSCHGYPRFTKDLDIRIERSGENASKIVCALKDFGLDFEGLSKEMFTDECRMTQMGREPSRVDILHTIKGAEFTEFFSRGQHRNDRWSADSNHFQAGLDQKQDCHRQTSRLGRCGQN